MAWANNENKLKACQSCRALIPANAAECESCGAAGHHVAAAGSLTDPLALLGAWPVTMILMMANVAVYAWVLIYQMQFAGEGGAGNGFAFEPIRFPDVLGAFGSVSAPEVRGSGEWWRLLAYAFLHGGVLHLGMNMYGLWQAGRMAEELLGRTQYVVLYVLSGLGGGLVIIAGKTSAVGASGALFGVIAGLWAHSYRRDSVLGKGFQQYMMMWLLYGVAMSFSPRVSWQGHLGGALIGAALAFFVLPAEDLFRQSMRRVRLTQAVAALCSLAVLVTFGLMARNLGKTRESYALQENTQRLYNLTIHVERLHNAVTLAQGAKQPALISAGNMKTFQKSFESWFGNTPDNVSDEKINEVLTQARQASCADVGTLERMAVPDAEFGRIRDSMHTALQAVCAKPTFTAYQLTLTKDLPTDDARAAFRRAFQSYWQWAEARAAQRQRPLAEMLPEDDMALIQRYLTSIQASLSDNAPPKPAR